MNRETQTGRRQRGVTLIEVLVALLILSFGLLGLAGLQGISLRNNFNAKPDWAEIYNPHTSSVDLSG